MAIQIRRGAASDFDATKMVSGELAVSTDGTHKVWATGAAGDSWELASKDDLDTVEENLGDVTEDVSDLKADLEQDYAQKDGVYPDLAAGILATDKHTSDSTPYLFRPTGGSKDVGNREYVDAVVGGTVAENQLAKPVTSDYWRAENNVSVAFTDSVATFTSQTVNNGIKSNAQKQVAASHVYYIGFSFQSGSASIITCFYGGNGGVRVSFTSETSMTGVYKIAKADASASGSVIYLFPSAGGVNVEHKVKNVMLIDLTQMFGTTIADHIHSLESATAGAGIAKLREWGFDLDTYHPYDAGTLKSVEGLVSHDMVGFNQWDEEWENGSIDSNGQNVAYTRNMRSKNYIRVLPNTQYFATPKSRIVTYWYDGDKKYISMSPASDWAITSPPNAQYMRFRTTDGYGTTYNHDICINLSNPSRNGEYEPYVKHSYPLDSSLTLRGIPKLDSANNLYYDGDTYESDGTVTRKYGVVDLGTLDWIVNSKENSIFMTNIPNMATVSSADYIKRKEGAICSKYQPAVNISVSESMDDKAWLRLLNDIYIRDTSYTDAAAFKAAMSGVYLVYELATPTTESAEPYTSYQVCDPDGTEEYVTTGDVPVGHETRYPENLRAKIEGLPWDFSSLIAPTEKTTTASRNYTAGSLLIMNNTLYKVTANIANGGTITPNTNVTATTLSEIISALAQ